jgi:anti-sigma28 factor (negative regulator of flagellin synthesis)
MTKEQFIKLHKEYTEKMHELVKAKNHDYTGNSNNPFSNFEFSAEFADTTVEQGILTRISDKFARFKSFLKQGVLKVQDEKIVDTLLDASNYLLIVAAYIESKKGVKEENYTPKQQTVVEINKKGGF